MMNWKPHPLAIAGLAMISLPMIAEAKIYLSIEQAQKILMPNKQLSKMPMIITDDLQEKMRTASSIRHPFQGDQIWKTSDGGWFIVDEVVGKHEMITYAVGIHANGQIQGVEILEYNETYGEQIREKKWLQQFKGRDANQTLRFNEDIKNITGATLSSKHVTNGVQRLMVLYREYLSKA